MASTAYDTLQAARAMEATGLERAQAEAIAQAIHQRGEDYATKADIASMREVMATKADLLQAERRISYALLAAVGVILAGVGVLLSIFI